jgi:DNA-binding protein HU-beta
MLSVLGFSRFSQRTSPYLNSTLRDGSIAQIFWHLSTLLNKGKVGENSMNKAELVNEIAESTGQSKLSVTNTVSALLHTVTAALSKGERVTLVGFGTFERRQRQARTGVNPQNPKQKLTIAAARVPVFRAGQELKDIVDGRSKLPAAPKAASSAPKKAGKSKAPAKKAAPAKKKAKKRR